MGAGGEMSTEADVMLATARYDARYWAERLGPYAEKMRERNDMWAVISVALGALTGLSIWTVLAESPSVAAQVAVSIVVVLTALAGAIPLRKQYGECAASSALLASKYAEAYQLFVMAGASSGDSAEATRTTAWGLFREAELGRNQLSAAPSHLVKALQEDQARPSPSVVGPVLAKG